MEELLARCKQRADLLPTLIEGQRTYGYLRPDLLDAIARALGMPVNEVYGVASFYSFLSTKPLARNTIWVCKCLPCHLQGGDEILVAVRDELGIRLGETTPDQQFGLELTNCIGACDQAPALMVNLDRYGAVSPSTIKEILRKYR